jgi:membrane associated rhomboid family serine protease
MIPLKDENPSKTFPFVNTLLIVLNACIFAYQTFWFPGKPHVLFLRLGFIPYEITHLKDIYPPAWVPLILTVLTALFLHGGWLHFTGNMLYLWIFGDNVEDKLGHFKYLAFYMTCGVIASFAHALFNISSKVPTIGASGAIAGVLGAYVILFPGARIKTLIILIFLIQVVRIPAVLLLGYWILIQVVSGLGTHGVQAGTGVAWFAHIGGFACGLALAVFMKKHR